MEQAIVKFAGAGDDDLNDLERARAFAKKNNVPLEDGLSLAKVVNEIFEKTTEFKIINPVFITDYPVELSPLSQKERPEPGAGRPFRTDSRRARDGKRILGA